MTASNAPEPQAPEPQEDLIELEIAAFMGPHIRRTRIVLVLIGIFYAWTAYSSYEPIARWHQAMHEMAPQAMCMDSDDCSEIDHAELKSAVDLAYLLVIATGVAGIASIVLAVVAAKRATFAIYAATAIFAAHTALELYATKGLIVMNWLWWLGAIVLAMGFHAAYKAEQLRKARIPPVARALR